MLSLKIINNALNHDLNEIKIQKHMEIVLTVTDLDRPEGFPKILSKNWNDCLLRKKKKVLFLVPTSAFHNLGSARHNYC